MNPADLVVKRQSKSALEKLDDANEPFRAHLHYDPESGRVVQQTQNQVALANQQ